MWDDGVMTPDIQLKFWKYQAESQEWVIVLVEKNCSEYSDESNCKQTCIPNDFILFFAVINWFIATNFCDQAWVDNFRDPIDIQKIKL